MKIWTRLLVAALVVWTLSSGQAWGTIVNGDFATGDLTGWEASPPAPGAPPLVLVGVVGAQQQLQMRVANSYAAADYFPGIGGIPKEGSISIAEVSQDVALVGGAPVGATALRFVADVQITGPADNTGAVAWVEVNYGGDVVRWSTASTTGLQTITIDLPGLVEADPVLQIYLHTESWLGPLSVPPVGDTDIVVDATFDNFEFIKAGVIPEPLTIFSAMLAIGGLGAYIRRRTGQAA